MADTPESLLRDLIENRDPPYVAQDANRPYYCWFCGEFAASEREQRHEPDCFWVRAKALLREDRHIQ